MPLRVVVSSSSSSSSSIVAVNPASELSQGGERCNGLQKVLRSSFALEQSDPRIPLKKSTFSTGCADRIARSKKKGSTRHFFDCGRMPDLIYILYVI